MKLTDTNNSIGLIRSQPNLIKGLNLIRIKIIDEEKKKFLEREDNERFSFYNTPVKTSNVFLREKH